MAATTRARGDTSGRMKREQPPGPDRETAQEEHLLHQAHRPQEDRPGDPDDPERRRGRRGGPHPGRLPSREEVVPAGRPSEQGRQLPHCREGPEEELPRAEGDHDRGHHSGQRPLASGAQQRRADLPAEPVPTRAVAEIVELVEVGVLTEGKPDAPGQERPSPRPEAAAPARRGTPRRWRRRILDATGGRDSG